MFKMMMAAAGLSIGLMMMPVATAPARADIKIDINLNGGRISCKTGARIVWDYGFYDVRVRDCRGSTYTYFGRRKGKRFIIDVSSKRGRITDIRRINYW